MKIRYLFSILPICLVFLLSGCTASAEEIAKNNLAEIHYNYFTGSTQNFKVSMWSGVREEPYETNGIRESLVDFCVISVVPQNNVSTFGLSYTVEINSKTYNGEFEQSPFDKTLAADLEIQLNESDSIFAYIIVDGVTEISKMECISKNFGINSTQALDIAIKNYSQEILTLSNNGKISLEGYCKIISTDKNLGVYFWYIRFVNVDKKEISMVIDTNTGEIVAKKL